LAIAGNRGAERGINNYSGIFLLSWRENEERILKSTRERAEKNQTMPVNRIENVSKNG
jgi:hypothetical protein